MSGFEALLDVEEGGALLARYRDARRALVEEAEIQCFEHDGKVTLPFVSKGMAAWQKQYHTQCGEACCFLDACGRTTCTAGGSNCVMDVTPVRRAQAQPTRYVCLDVNCQETSGLGFVCASCFSDSAFLHEHADFVCVSPEGEHTVVRRLVGLADRRQISLESELPRLAAPAADANATCALCELNGDTRVLDASDLPAYVPGCDKHFHTGVGSSIEGPICAGCVLACLQGRRSDYTLVPRSAADSSPPLPRAPCVECRLLSEEEVFGAQASAARREARAAWERSLASSAEGGGGGGGAGGVGALREAWKAAAAAAEAELGLTSEQSITNAAATQSWPDEDEGGEGEEEEMYFKLLRATFGAFKTLHPQTHIQAAGKRAILD